MHRFSFRDPAFLGAVAAAGGGFNPEDDVSGLELWLDASQEAHSDTDTNVAFNDQRSGGLRDYTAVDGITYRTGITPQGTAVMRYGSGVGTGHVSSFNFATAGYTEAELFYVCAVASGAGTNGGPIRFGTSGQADFYPFSGGDIYNDSLSNTRRNFAPAATLTDWHVISIAGSGSEWTYRIDGTTKLTTGTNTFGIRATNTYIGSSETGVLFDGDIAEVLLYSSILSAPDRASVISYLTSKHIA